MKILRNNLAYELTKEELFAAWQEVQTEKNREAVREVLKADTTTQEYHLLANNEAFISSVIKYVSNFQQKIGWSLEKVITKEIRASKNTELNKMFSETERKLLAGLYQLGVYSFEEIGLGIILLEASSTSAPKSLEDVFALFSNPTPQIYEYCDELSPQAKQILSDKIIPALETIRHNRLPDLNIENLYDFLGMSTDFSQTKYISL